MRAVLILGANSAIAGESARYFAEQGISLILVARNLEKLEVLGRDLLARGAPAVGTVVADLALLSNQAEVLREIELTGIAYDSVYLAYGSLTDQQRAQSDFAYLASEFQVNFLSVVAWLEYFAAEFEKRKSGSIAVITSVAGDRGRQSNYVYGTAKGALGLYLQGLRNRLALKGVSVTEIKPGFVDTPMTQSFTKGPLWASAKCVGRAAAQAQQRGKDIVYLPWFWWVIMQIICSIPEKIFKKLKL